MNRINEQSDRGLLDRVHAGSDDAATQLYLKYAERLRAVAQQQTASDLKSRVDPEDIVQSVFRTFFRRAARGEYTVPEGEELWRLFLVIALNKVRATGKYHHAKRRDARQTTTAVEIDDVKPVQNDSDQTALATLRMTIDDLLHNLPPWWREVIEMRVEGHEVSAIAEKTGRAKRSIERALQEFRHALDRELGDLNERGEAGA